MDQLFSILAQTLKGKEVSTLDELVEVMESAPIQPKPVVNVLYFISDWKKFVEPKLSKEKLSNHSGYHCFKVSKEVSKEGSKVCFRGKVLSTDEKWHPKQGIQLLVVNPKLCDTIQASEFRFEHIRMKSVMDDIQNKYLPMLETKKRQETESRWKALEKTFQKLEKERKCLNALSFSDLPKFRIPPSPDSSDLVIKTHETTTAMWGTFYPDVVLEGNVQDDAKIGLDVIIYTDSKASRPWVGVINSIGEDGQTYTIHWYKRAPGGGIRYKPDFRKGTAYLSDVDKASVMLYSVADHLENGDLDLSEWYDKVMETYQEHDDCYP